MAPAERDILDLANANFSHLVPTKRDIFTSPFSQYTGSLPLKRLEVIAPDEPRNIPEAINLPPSPTDFKTTNQSKKSMYQALHTIEAKMLGMQ